MASDFKYEIVKHIAVLSERGSGWTRELNLIKWNDGGVKLDIRDWSPGRDKMKKGMTFNKYEFLNLVKAVRYIDANEISETGSRPEKQPDNKTAASSGDTVEFPEPLDKAVNE